MVSKWRAPDWGGPIDEDPTTGLPRLPEPYYWKVTRSWLTFGEFWDIRVMRPRPMWFAKRIIGTTSSSPISETAIRSQATLAITLYGRAVESDMELRSRPGGARGLYGRYPTKSVSEAGRMLGDFK